MRRSLCAGVALLALLSLPTASAFAQETGTPNFKSPYRAFAEHEFGASFSDYEAVSGAFEGFYTYGRGQNDFGVRAGFADPSGEGDTRFVVGGNFRTQVVRYSESFPLDGALTLGLGGNIGDGDDVFFIPVGIALGRAFTMEGSNTTFVPYVHPVLVPTFGGASDDVEFALGLGVNVALSERWAVRASGGLGDIEGIGLSVAYIR
jgi:opacity protein-like surface antigen